MLHTNVRLQLYVKTLFIPALFDDRTPRQVPINSEFQNLVGLVLDNGNILDSAGDVNSIDQYLNKITPEHNSFQIENFVEPDSTSEVTYDDNLTDLPSIANETLSIVTSSSR